MSQEKTKVYQKLLSAHDELYDCIEALGDIRAKGEQMDQLTRLLDRLLGVEALLEFANNSNIWKGDN
jgi:hypothetical protein